MGEAARLTGPSDRKIRANAMGVLWNLAAEVANQETMWKDEHGVRAALVEASVLTHQEDRDVRTRAEGALSCLKAVEKEEQARAASAEAKQGRTAAGTEQERKKEKKEKKQKKDEQDQEQEPPQQQELQ